MIVATTENIVGHRTVQTLGQCFGVVVRSRGLGGNIMASLRTIVGGEIHEYTRAGTPWIGWLRTRPRWAPTPS
jgi:uncharacterized protein YbjQ (UPF0145 family)